MSITDTQLETFLAQIAASGVFGKSTRRKALLEYLLRAELRGKGDALKAYSIGLDVMGRSENFDPTTDSIVRVEMGRLRDALGAFYATNTTVPLIRVSIPKGTYRPTILSPEQIDETPSTVNRAKTGWPVLIAVLVALLGATGYLFFRSAPAAPPSPASISLQLSAKEAADSKFLRDFANSFRQALTKRRTFSLYSGAPPGTKITPDFEIRLQVIGQPEPGRISLELIDTEKSLIRWADAYAVENIETQADIDQLVSHTVDDLFPQILSSSKEALNARPLETLNAWELYLLSTWVPGSALSTLDWELQRVNMALLATQKEPDLGQAYSVLSDKLMYLSSVDSNHHTQDIVRRAASHAHKAMKLAPRDANTLFNLGIYHWHAGHNKSAVAMFRRIGALDPFDGFARFLAEVFPYTCRAAPDSVVRRARSFDQDLKSDNPIRWVTLTWISMLHLNRDELALALEAETKAHLIFHTPDTVMRHAVILHGLGKTSEATHLLKEEAESWPNLEPSHFARITIPRRCREFPKAIPLLERYRAFAADFDAISK